MRRFGSTVALDGVLSMIHDAMLVGFVGIRNTHARKNCNFERFHGFCLSGFFVVITEQMQHAVDREMRDMVLERFALRRRLARDGFISHRNITQMHKRLSIAPYFLTSIREAEHIGGFVLPTVLGIESLYFSIIREDNRDR